MKWLPIPKVDTNGNRIGVDKYAVRSDCGEYTIARVNVMGETLYEPYHRKDSIARGKITDPEQAKSVCLNHKLGPIPEVDLPGWDGNGESGAVKDEFSKFCRGFVYVLIWLWVAAALNLIDFHVCIKDAGHCKIVDPTEAR